MTDKAPQEMESDIWAGEMGDKWNTYLDQFESMIAPVGESALAAANFQPGEEVIDIGCGGGITSFQIAQKVTSTGHVTGLDLSPTLVATSKKRAADLGLANVDIVEGDAGKIDLKDKQYDCLFSRFGIMFFEDPEAAFKHMHGFIKPGGRLNFACWGPPPANPWVFQLMEIAKKYVEVPPSDPTAPGPFAFSDPERVQDILAKAGFSDVVCTSCDGEQLVGGAGATPEIAARFVMDVLFIGDLLENESEEVKVSAYNDLVAFLQDYQTEAGVVLKCNIWLVSGKP